MNQREYKNFRQRVRIFLRAHKCSIYRLNAPYATYYVAWPNSYDKQWSGEFFNSERDARERISICQTGYLFKL